MTADYSEQCVICGRPILQVTATATGGLCRGCERARAQQASSARWAEARHDGLAPLTARNFSALASDPDLERACHVVFDKAHWKWTVMGREALSGGEITVIAVETFFGETCNGGLAQYLGNESGAFGNDVSEALLRVGPP
jgi:Domain of unknown function (DUF4375)